MKNTIFTLLLLISLPTFSQVGIGTELPTADLDVNGSLRVRDLGSGGLVSDGIGNISIGPKIASLGKVSATGVALNISGATVTRENEGDYKVTFSTALSSNNYVILLNLPDCGGSCDGNASYDDATVTYYGQTMNEFYVNIGDSDNGNNAKQDVDLEFMFIVYDF